MRVVFREQYEKISVMTFIKMSLMLCIYEHNNNNNNNE